MEQGGWYGILWTKFLELESANSATLFVKWGKAWVFGVVEYFVVY